MFLALTIYIYIFTHVTMKRQIWIFINSFVMLLIAISLTNYSVISNLEKYTLTEANY